MPLSARFLTLFPLAALLGACASPDAPRPAPPPPPEVVESVAPDLAGARDAAFGSTPERTLDLKNAGGAGGVTPVVREMPLEVERQRRLEQASALTRRKALQTPHATAKKRQPAEDDSVPIASEARYREITQQRLQKAWEASPEGVSRRRLSRSAGAVAVEAVIHVTPDGAVGSAALLKGSGSDALDEALLAVIRSLALPRPPRDCGPVFVLLRL